MSFCRRQPFGRKRCQRGLKNPENCPKTQRRWVGDWVRQRRKGSLPVSKKEAGSQNKDNFVKQCCYKLGKKKLGKRKVHKIFDEYLPSIQNIRHCYLWYFCQGFIGEQYRPRQRKYCRGYFEKQL